MNFESLQLGSNTSLLIKIGTITINMFLPMRNKFVYSCSIKIHAWQKLRKHLLPPSGCGSIFPTKSCWDPWNGSQLARSKVNMADEAKLHRPTSSTFWSAGCVTCSQCSPWRRTGPFLLTIVGCRCWSFQCISPMCWAYFSDVMVSPGFRKL